MGVPAQPACSCSARCFLLLRNKSRGGKVDEFLIEKCKYEPNKQEVTVNCIQSFILARVWELR